MESWIQRIFLGAAGLGAAGSGCVRNRHLRLCAWLVCALCCVPLSVSAQDDDDELGKIITPDIERREIREDMLDSEDFEIGAFFGLLNVEDFGSNPVTGFTL